MQLTLLSTVAMVLFIEPEENLRGDFVLTANMWRHNTGVDQLKGNNKGHVRRTVKRNLLRSDASQIRG